ncbi:response regulator transcription factor [Rhodococcus wratislaviensis]|uniref:LuxR C-terminal-related transcriptional regulator n=1 Tax=Rhodococcus wratislaviensis TaxID=44752 RepID=UPI000F5768E5|nr:response regulator transcription factor [Rhodococcus wratislaviensis]RYE42528.1 MAG: response regulator [Hyphomicrobiales bacterium]
MALVGAQCETGRTPDLLRLFLIVAIRFYREGLAEVLGKLPDVAEVGTAAGGPDGLARVRHFAPHVVLLDMSLRDSSETARSLVRVVPEAKVVALGVPETETHVVACAEIGIEGYVSRDGSLDDLVASVRAVARGETVCSAQISAGLMRRIAVLAELGHAARPLPRLTARENEIVDLIALGLANREIARELGIELCTVKNHVHHILEKLGVRHRVEVLAYTRHGG